MCTAACIILWEYVWNDFESAANKPNNSMCPAADADGVTKK